jgi:hypothetical protein
MTDQEVQAACWSDLHKDVFGCRPGAHQPNPTHEEYEALVRRLDVEMEYERRAQVQAQYAFERNVEYLTRGQAAMTRLQAVRALINRAVGGAPRVECNPSYDTSDRSEEIPDWSYVAYSLNVCYALTDQLRLQYEGAL